MEACRPGKMSIREYKSMSEAMSTEEEKTFGLKTTKSHVHGVLCKGVKGKSVESKCGHSYRGHCHKADGKYKKDSFITMICKATVTMMSSGT